MSKLIVTGTAAQQFTPPPHVAAARYRATGEQVAVSFQAVIARINRALTKENEQLKTARGGRTRTSVGDHYVADLSRNFVVRQHVDVEELARELEVLAPWENIKETNNDQTKQT